MTLRELAVALLAVIGTAAAGRELDIDPHQRYNLRLLGGKIGVHNALLFHNGTSNLTVPGWPRHKLDRPVVVYKDPDETRFNHGSLLVANRDSPTYLAIQGPQLIPDWRLAMTPKPYHFTTGKTTIIDRWNTVKHSGFNLLRYGGYLQRYWIAERKGDGSWEVWWVSPSDGRMIHEFTDYVIVDVALVEELPWVSNGLEMPNDALRTVLDE